MFQSLSGCVCFGHVIHHILSFNVLPTKLSTAEGLVGSHPELTAAFIGEMSKTVHTAHPAIRKHKSLHYNLFAPSSTIPVPVMQFVHVALGSSFINVQPLLPDVSQLSHHFVMQNNLALP